MLHVVGSRKRGQLEVEQVILGARLLRLCASAPYLMHAVPYVMPGTPIVLFDRDFLL